MKKLYLIGIRIIVTLLIIFCIGAVIVSCGSGNNKSKENEQSPLIFELYGEGYAVSHNILSNEKNIVIPSTYDEKPVIAIKDEGFSETLIESITIPDSVVKIGKRAFYHSWQLEEVIFGNGVKKIEDEAFYLCSSLINVTIPKSVQHIGLMAFSCYNLENIEVDKDNQYYKSIDGVLYSKDEKTLVFYPKANYGDERIPKIHDGVENIAAYAFYNNTRIGRVEIPDSVINIGDHAFSECTNIVSIVLGEGVQTIGQFAFSGCEDLVWLTLGSNIKRIEAGAFKGSFPEPKHSIYLPDGLTYIGDMAFSNCLISGISIPNTVTYIGSSAFSVTFFDTIGYRGTKAEWNKIAKGSSWFGYGDMTVVCEDGRIKYKN